MGRPTSDGLINDIKSRPTKHPDICKRVRQLRIGQQLTQAEFGLMIGFSESDVKRVEYGRGAPTIEMLRAIKKRFRLTYDYLIDGSKN